MKRFFTGVLAVIFLVTVAGDQADATCRGKERRAARHSGGAGACCPEAAATGVASDSAYQLTVTSHHQHGAVPMPGYAPGYAPGVAPGSTPPAAYIDGGKWSKNEIPPATENVTHPEHYKLPDGRTVVVFPKGTPTPTLIPRDSANTTPPKKPEREEK